MAQVIVVGGGLGGLAAAVRLQADGHHVTLVEARETLGGRAGQIRERGFTFDTGPTIVTAPDLLVRLWQHAGRSLADDLELIPLRPFYEIRFRDGSHFRYGDAAPSDSPHARLGSALAHGTRPGSGVGVVLTRAPQPSIGDGSDTAGVRAALEREVSAFSPGDLAGYRAFMAATERIYHRAFAQLAGQPFHELRQFVSVVPELLKLGAHRSVYDLAARYFQDERLRVVFSFHPLFIGGNPFRASAIYSIIPYLEQQGGVWYVRGGTFALVCALERLFRALGGEVRTGQPVREIVVRDVRLRSGQTGRRVAGVCLENGETVPAEIVVSNADVAATLGRLLPAPLRRRGPLRRQTSYSMSCFLLYLGLDRQYPELAHHTVLMPRDFRHAVSTIFRGRLDHDDLAVYVHTPTRTDPSLAPPGCESVYALVPVPNLAGPLDWSDGGDALRDRTIALLRDELGLADLERHIAVERRFTPLDFRDDLRSHLGAAFSIEPTLWQSAYFRPHNRQSAVPGLYLVGAGTHPGAGIPGVLLSAEIAAGLVRDDLAAAG